MQITTKIQAKTLVSSLRRELKTMSKSPDRLSHSDCLTVMARTMGFASWNEWEASLAEAPVQTPVIQEPASDAKPKYPLVNEGQFDFIGKGEPGTPLTGHFQELQGTLEKLAGSCRAEKVTRAPFGVKIDYCGRTQVWWEEQKTVIGKDGRVIWVDEDGSEYSEAALVFLPEGYGGDPTDDEDLPVRDALVQAYLDCCAEHGIASSGFVTRRGKLSHFIGFALTEKEDEAVLHALKAKEERNA